MCGTFNTAESVRLLRRRRTHFSLEDYDGLCHEVTRTVGDLCEFCRSRDFGSGLSQQWPGSGPAVARQWPGDGPAMAAVAWQPRPGSGPAVAEVRR